MSLVKLLSFKSLGDERGNLISLEQNKNVPFEIKRVYYLFNTDKDVTRGFHAHKALQQVAICVKGSCLFTLDDGTKREKVKLDDPTVGLYIGNNLWREMSEFTYDCVLMVIASELYDESDYIRDYDQFLKEVSL
ncbi:FdtA/QdtA family cupin domain-containing protein [Pseudoalteromonas shioyasakiensis]|uniref:FdtA/QdtA family cupin domain-containing protein n=1 Tax=Pseudoalteromonas shioyasakiensis TaxID=1190813 RepID=A0ABT6U527_9GAMM|nr:MULTISPECIES: FdtA/QdtA family cupin domain-containing protein [Pseudoalteromonas]MDI4671268.1 FdtA/QdtA family cupin domain-containing protein [Pseudoalteromonas shioyasakiensis]MDI4673395.1 FdtA/QdtA family cupin domain-containing protein [Pseudoalteromonas shioyasakiensis]MDI4688177.1 FdtA/QdtA family cupin domain-containing protein [Pseudoalteromonas shioyasakiensis]MDI4706773.1 FdtA/QdtA family cupin domain-containing protein [Pseudoalteromonas shioyasakiensis]NUJ23489.1 WxcM-like doma